MPDCIKVCITNVDTVYFRGMQLPSPLTTLIKTCSSLKNYASEVERKTSYLLKYFLLFTTLTIFISTTIFVQRLVPQLVKDANTASEELLVNYPTELVFTWDGTTLTSTHPEVSVNYPSLFTDPNEMGLPQSLAIITMASTKEEVTNSQNYLFVITPTTLHMQEAQDSWSEFALTTLLPANPITATKETVAQWLTNLNTQLSVNQTALSVGLVVAFGLMQLLFTFLGLLWKSLLVFLFSRLFGVKAQFIQTFKLSILLLVPALVIQMVGDILYPTLVFDFTNLTFWLLYMLLVWQGPLEKVLPSLKTSKK